MEGSEELLARTSTPCLTAVARRDPEAGLLIAAIQTMLPRQLFKFATVTHFGHFAGPDCEASQILRFTLRGFSNFTIYLCTYLLAHVHTYLHTHILTQVEILTYILTYIDMYTYTYILTYLFTYLLAHIHTYLHYIHTYLHK